MVTTVWPNRYEKRMENHPSHERISYNVQVIALVHLKTAFHVTNLYQN